MTREHQPVTYFSRLDADECWALLADAEIGRIAWLGDDGISILPINFVIDDGTVVFNTSPSSPLARLVEPTEVAFEADDIDNESAVGWSVIVRGITGPATEPERASISWLDDRPIRLAITASTVAGRVVSGTRES
ncbi:pyridoxamine 5'-phosphate oxidase family protein [Tessaracoccus defluvii]|uniref:pyridoxamine 5'-phosphate oxidase family protein n=1 Tax=Tessaracoccus defluvii TaxID=1285901 RepID=UPI0031D1B351